MVLRGSAETSKTPDLFMKLLSEDLGKPVQKREIVWCGYRKEIMKPNYFPDCKCRTQPWVDK